MFMSDHPFPAREGLDKYADVESVTYMSLKTKTVLNAHSPRIIQCGFVAR